MKFYNAIMLISFLMSCAYVQAYKHEFYISIPDGTYTLKFEGHGGLGPHVTQNIGFVIEKSVIKSTNMPGRPGHYAEKLKVEPQKLTLSGGGLCYNKLTLLDKNGTAQATWELGNATILGAEMPNVQKQGCFDTNWIVSYSTNYPYNGYYVREK